MQAHMRVKQVMKHDHDNTPRGGVLFSMLGALRIYYHTDNMASKGTVQHFLSGHEFSQRSNM